VQGWSYLNRDGFYQMVRGRTCATEEGTPCQFYLGTQFIVNPGDYGGDRMRGLEDMSNVVMDDAGCLRATKVIEDDEEIIFQSVVFSERPDAKAPAPAGAYKRTPGHGCVAAAKKGKACA